MATVAGVSGEPLGTMPARGRAARFVDRWIWVFTAALLTATALAGFVPDSIAKVALVNAGQRPPFPAALHVHAVLMGAWMLLLLTQTTLMATGRRRGHMQLGVAAMVLAPAMVITGLVLVPTMYGMAWVGVHAANPGLPTDAAPPQLRVPTNIVLQQIRVGVVFPVLVALALRARRTEPGLHKRLIILASVVPMGAAFSRIAWLPSSMPQSPLTLDLYPILLVAPLFAWDFYRSRRVHKAYVVWLALLAPFVVAGRLLWDTPGWFATVPRLLGVA